MIKTYKWLEDIVAIICFVIIIGIFFSSTIFQGKLPVPSDSLVGLYHPFRDYYANTNPRGVPFKNFLITDPVRQQIPWRKVVIDQWKDGRIPAWNPFSFSGASLTGNIQAGVFYPLNIIFFLLPFTTAWAVLIMLEPLLAGLFIYIFLRHKKLSTGASLLGALSWSFSGFSVAWLTWGTIVHVALWVPLILLSIDLLTESKLSTSLHSTILKFIIFVMALCVQLFAGHAQISFYVLMLSFAYALWKIRLAKTERITMFVWVSLGYSLFVVITSVQWIPFLRATIDSSRLLDLAVWTHPGWFLPWQHLVQYLVPDFFGNPATMNYRGEWNYGEFIGYIGVVGLLFAGFALLQWKRITHRFWIAILGIALLFIFPTPIARLPYIFHLPFFSAMQPTRLTVIVDFALAILAAYGFDAWKKSKEKSRWFILIGFGTVIVVFWIVTIWQINIADTEHWLVTKRNLILPSIIFAFASTMLVLHSIIRQRNIQSLLIVSIIVLSMFDLLRFAIKFTPFVQSSYFFPTTNVLAFLQNQPKPFRIVSLNKEILAPNISSMYGIETIEGYDPIASTRYEEFFAALARGKPDISTPFGFNRILTTEHIDSPLTPLLNVRYVLSLTDRTERYLIKVFQEGETRVYEDKRALPRVYLATDIMIINDKQKIFDTLYDRTFNSRKTAIVEESISLVSVPMNVDDRATIELYQPSSLIISVQTRVPRLLVIANSWSPSWRATIDGTMVNLLRTNYILQGVVVPKGAHRVQLSI